MATTRGRIEGAIVVPTGGWTCTVGAGTATIAAGTYYGKVFLATVGVAFATAASTSCTITGGLGENGTGLVTITFGSAKAITWVSTDLRDILGFTANSGSATSHVSTQHMRGVWLPNCHYQAPNEIGDTYQGWHEGDVRSAANKGGYVWTHMGPKKTVTWLRWPFIARSKTWQANETTVNASLERFWRDCVWGEPTWGNAGGPIRFYPNAADDGTYATYWVTDASDYRPQPTHNDWAGGPWRCEFKRLVVVPGGAATWTLPDNAAEWVATFPSITIPTSIWPMQDAALPAVDTISGNNLDSGNASGDERVQQTGEPSGRYDIFLEDIQSHIRVSANTVLDLTTGNFTVFFYFQVDPAETAATSKYFARKKSASAATNGWATKFGSGSALSLIFDTPSSTQVNADGAVAVDDDEWHFAMAVIDRTGGNIHLYVDGEHVSADISAHAGGSLTNTAIFGFGDTQGTLNSCAKVHYSYAACWNGTALTQADFDLMRNA